jgi:hypothetical protein
VCVCWMWPFQICRFHFYYWSNPSQNIHFLCLQIKTVICNEAIKCFAADVDLHCVVVGDDSDKVSRRPTIRLEIK